MGGIKRPSLHLCHGQGGEASQVARSDCLGPVSVWCAEIASIHVNTLSVGQSEEPSHPGKSQLAMPIFPHSCGLLGPLQQHCRSLRGQGRRLGSIMEEVMRTDLQRTEQAQGEGSNRDSLVDWTPGQVEGRGTSLAWACP